MNRSRGEPNLPWHRKAADVNALVASLDSSTPAYILVDPLLGEPLADIEFGLSPSEAHAAREECWDREITQVNLHGRIALPAEMHPYLITLHGTTDPLIESSLLIAQAEQVKAFTGGFDCQGTAAHRIGGWLQSTMHAAQLAETISMLCSVNTTAYTKATYMRLVDRRVLALMSHLVGIERMRLMLGRIQRWSYLNAVGGISTIAGMLNGERSDPVLLNEAEWSFMSRGEVVNRTLGQWFGELSKLPPDSNAALDIREIYSLVCSAALNADEARKKWPHRFTEPYDQSTFAALALQHPSILTDRSIADLLAETGTEDEPATLLRYLPAELCKRLHFNTLEVKHGNESSRTKVF